MRYLPAILSYVLILLQWALDGRIVEQQFRLRINQQMARLLRKLHRSCRADQIMEAFSWRVSKCRFSKCHFSAAAEKKIGNIFKMEDSVAKKTSKKPWACIFTLLPFLSGIAVLSSQVHPPSNIK